MTTIVQSFLILSLLFIVGTIQAQWELHTAKDNTFQVLLPCEAKIVDEVDDLGVQQYSFSCTANDKSGIYQNTLYMVTCITYPEALLLPEVSASSTLFYKNSINDMVEAIDGRLLYEKTVFLGEHEGRQIKILFNNNDLGGKNVARIRLFLIGQQYYIMQTITLPQNDNNEFIDKFMNSFQLLTKEEMPKDDFPVDSIQIDSVHFEITDAMEDGEIVLTLKLKPFILEGRVVEETLEFIVMNNQAIAQGIYGAGYHFTEDELLEGASIYVQSVHNPVDLKRLKVIKTPTKIQFEIDLYLDFEYERTPYRNQTITRVVEQNK